MQIAISRHGYPFLSATLVVLLLTTFVTIDWSSWARYPLIVFFVLSFLLFLIFFRDPERNSTADPRSVLAPADGRVIQICETPDGAKPGSNGTLISIFMSLLNVHVNRIPISGKVIEKEYRPGRFIPAFKDEAPHQNEQCSLTIQNNGQSIQLKQVAGILARRIITYPEKGDTVVRGDRLGMILFGSRLDIVLPSGSRVMVSDGQKTVAGETVLGIL